MGYPKTPVHRQRCVDRRHRRAMGNGKTGCCTGKCQHNVRRTGRQSSGENKITRPARYGSGGGTGLLRKNRRPGLNACPFSGCRNDSRFRHSRICHSGTRRHGRPRFTTCNRRQWSVNLPETEPHPDVKKRQATLFLYRSFHPVFRSFSRQFSSFSRRQPEKDRKTSHTRCKVNGKTNWKCPA